MRVVLAQSVIVILWLAALAWNPPPRLLPVMGLFTIVGLGLGVASLLLALVALRDLGSAFGVGPAPRSNSQLVQHGVYARLRHPMYTALVILALAGFLLRPSWAVGLVGTVLLLFLLAKARYEEGLLCRRHPEYHAYRVRTRGVLGGRGGS